MNTLTETENPAALQLKILHYTELSLYVLEGIYQIPKGFTVVTTAEGVMVSFIRDINTEGEAILEEKEFIAEPAKLVNVYRFLWECIEEARVYERQLSEKSIAFSNIDLNPPALVGGAFSERQR
ncbi:hypothetical protein [Emticicia sp. BO119]|uniref:hypothetical protein n=1 Tax=Emticicia sp. BO119 TaxID=2757768 RepID=UPI0015F063BE|nr:hypothetical protein [Emticicia sp. BO119]MBA4852031.1 hypothetical protein [Emticicia sp. BO119]